MKFDTKEQNLKNQEALANPQPGDYWNEMFCPYFVVVEVVKDDQYRVLSCLGGPTSFHRKDELNARVDNKDGTWSFDYSKSMLVDRAWIEKAVRYEYIDGFVADVWRSEKTELIVQEWRNWKQRDLRDQIRALESQWEQFTGWKYLKEDVTQ